MEEMDEDALTGALGVTLMLPFTFSMSASRGLAMLIGIYVGGVSGGLVASVMLNIPGNAAAICTCFDGAPMARKGQPYRALSYGISASFIGGIFSAVCLIIMAPALADVGLMFGTWEYFALGERLGTFGFSVRKKPPRKQAGRRAR